MMALRSTKLGILVLIFALILVPGTALAQSQEGGAGAAGAATKGEASTPAAAGGAAGAGATSGLSTAAIVGIAAGVAAITAIAIAAGGGDGGTTAGHTTPGH